MRRRTNFSRIGKNTAVLTALLAVSMVFSAPAFGAEKPESMDDASWERLQDNVLEYDELEDRVANFNPTMLQIVRTIDDSYDTVSENAADYQEAANDFLRLYEDAVDEGDYESAYMYQINRRIALQMSSTYLKQENRKDTIMDRNTRQYRKMFTSACQQLMVAYNQMAVNQATLEKQVELYGQMAALARTQGSMGMNTQTDILSAEANLHSAQSSLTQLNDQMASVKRSLLLMTGWDYDADITIGPVPEPDMEAIAAADLEADTEKAVNNNYDLIAIRHQSRATSTPAQETRDRNLRDTEASIRIAMGSLYETLQQQRAAKEGADAAWQKAVNDKAALDQKYQLGMVGRLEYLQGELTYLQAQSAKLSADISLRKAYEDYLWQVKGVSVASTATGSTQTASAR